jgi:hypothetical protein
MVFSNPGMDSIEEFSAAYSFDLYDGDPKSMLHSAIAELF